MRVQFQSPLLASQVQDIITKQKTGCLSIDHDEGEFRRYGTLQFQEGKLTGAQYYNQKGQEALSTLKDLTNVSLSFASGALTLF